MLLGQALCCHARLYVVRPGAMLSRRTLCCQARRYVARPDAMLSGQSLRSSKVFDFFLPWFICKLGNHLEKLVQEFSFWVISKCWSNSVAFLPLWDKIFRKWLKTLACVIWGLLFIHNDSVLISFHDNSTSGCQGFINQKPPKIAWIDTALEI